MVGETGNVVTVQPSPRNICAIVVSYHPDDGFEERVKILRGQVGGVVVVDNDSADLSLGMLKTMEAESGVHLILNEQNLGVAAALNKGVRYAKDNGFDWILTMDQDSVAFSSMVGNLIEAYGDCPFRDQVGVIGANFVDKSTGKSIYRKEGEGKTWLQVNDVITSGSLVALPVIEDIGPFREDLFIDYVDIEFCLRLRAAGYSSIIALKTSMQHSLGECEEKKFLGRSVIAFNYPPFRHYYRTRNALLLAREPIFWKDPKWTLVAIQYLLLSFVKVALYEENKLEKAKFIGLGIGHALMGKSGKLNLKAVEPRKGEPAAS